MDPAGRLTGALGGADPPGGGARAAPAAGGGGRCGGRLAALDARRGSLLSWAGALRTAAAEADLVVLHVNPYDVIAPIAFGGRRVGPPVVYLDHADQVFWVGAGVAEVVASLRESGAALARERRGIAPERVALLPIALGEAPPLRELPRALAKCRLGLPEDAVVLLTVARWHKYDPLDGVSFPDALLPVLERHERAVLLAVGPDEEAVEGEPWAGARRRTGGRVRALGTREGTALFYQAADVYLDSFPRPSNTSLLEAGSYGTPLVSRCPPGPPGSVLGADGPGLDGHLLLAPDLPSYRAAVGRLIQDGALRARVGEATRRAIAGTHAGPGWQRALEALYGRAAGVPPVGEPAGTAVPPGASAPAERPAAGELDTQLLQHFAGEPGLTDITRYNLRLLPPDLRLRAWLDLLAAEGTCRPGLLLPEWLAARLERWRYPRGSDALRDASDSLAPVSLNLAF